MERTEYVDWLIIFGAYGWMIASGFIFRSQPSINFASQMASMVSMILYLVIKDAYAVYASAKYLYMPSVIRPINKKFPLFIIRPGKWMSVENPHIPNFYTTELMLGVYVKQMGPYSGVEKIRITHDFPFERRIQPHQGKCNYKGNVVTHNQVSEVVLYAIGPSAVGSEESKPVPTFYLKEAPGDVTIPELRSVTPMQHIVGNPNPKISRVINHYESEISTLQGKVSEISTYASTKGQQASYWHEKYNEVYAYAQQLQEEITGLLKHSPKFMEGVVRWASSRIMNIDDIRQLAKMGSWWSRFDFKAIAMVIIAAMGLAFIATQPDVKRGIGNFVTDPRNQVVVVILGFLAVAAIYYIAKLRRKK